MHAANVTDVPSVVVAAGNRDFCHIRNTDQDATIYVKYDGSATTLAPDNGMPIPPGGTLVLDNDSRLFNKQVVAVADTGITVEVRIQGGAEP